MTTTKNRILLVGIVALIGAMFLLTEPVPQPPAYHQFADDRNIFGTPNFWNVATNIAFLLSGLAGLHVLRAGEHPGVVRELLPAYRLFFAGIFLTAFGSAWYHLAPANNSLFWDRLPMTLGFMGFFVVVIGEHVSIAAARKLLVPLLVVGVLSVVYWYVSEIAGTGDVRPYAIVQFLPMLVIPVILLVYPTRFDTVGFYWWMLVIYVLSKLVEHFDGQILAATGLISGHSVKHLLAAAAPLVFVHGIRNRRPREVAA